MNLKDYLQAIGSLKKLAAETEAHPPDMCNWASGKRPVPLHRAIAIDRATKGVVTCEELRPDVDWAYLRGTAKPEKEIQEDS